MTDMDCIYTVSAGGVEVAADTFAAAISIARAFSEAVGGDFVDVYAVYECGRRVNLRWEYRGEGGRLRDRGSIS